VGSVAFAGFTGSATTGVGYDLDTGEYGFIKQSTAVSVDVTLLENLGEAVGEGDIYASIKATLDFTFDNAEAGEVNDVTGIVVGANLDFDHAKVFGENWYVSILSAARAANFATSAIDTKELGRDGNALGYGFDPVYYAADLRSRDIFDRVSGVEVGYSDWVLGIGFTGDAINNAEEDNLDTTEQDESLSQYDETGYKLFASLQTPEFDLADGLTAKFGVAAFTQSATQSWEDGFWVYAPNNTRAWTPGSVVTEAANSVASAHAKIAYEDDVMSLSLGADAIYDNADIDADVALNAVYDMVTLDAYFATKSNYVNTDDQDASTAAPANLLSAQVAVDLDPIVVTVTGADLINAQDLSAEVAFAATEELTVTGRGGYVISGAKAGAWNGGADVEYATDAYTVALGGTFRSTDRISLNASIESETIIPGATLKLAYAGDDLTEADPDDYDNGLKGQVLASVKIAF
jgi:hypothetical protein